jgi:hypothetical protein
MAIVPVSNGLLAGLSTDAKTAYPAGYRFIETDTGDQHVSDGTYWWLSTLGILSDKRIGFTPTGNSNTVGMGMLSVMTGASNPGSITIGLDNTHGRYTNFPTGAASTNKSGIRVAAGIGQREFNIRTKIRFQLVDTTLMRLYCGLMGIAEPTGDDPFGSGTVGIVCGITSGATNFEIMRNDTTGATVITSTGVAVDASPHIIKIVADEANSRFSWSFDNSAYTHYTTDIPAATNSLAFMAQAETNTSAAKTFKLYNGFIQADR